MKVTQRTTALGIKRSETLKSEGDKYVRKIMRTVKARDYTKPESALAISGDSEYQIKFAKIITELKTAKHVVVIGIGGSSLGIEALYHAVAMQRHARLHVLDAIDVDALERAKELIGTVKKLEDIAVCIISKSGNTTETVTNASEFIAAFESTFGDVARKRIVCIGTEGSDFLKAAKKAKVHVAHIPESIGGRYSVFTAVGYIPLSICGLDVESFNQGAQMALEKANRDQVLEQSARLVQLAESEGVHTVNFFTFNERLRQLGFWYRQLLAESIGKEMTTEGTTFSHQLLPTVATSVDLHSMAQLYLGGYKGMYTHFIYGDVESEYHKTADTWLMRHMNDLRKVTPIQTKNMIRKGVFKAYSDQQLPYRYTYLSKITAYEVGFLMQSLMLEVMVIGALFRVNVFTQPNVESYKSYTRDLLARS